MIISKRVEKFLKKNKVYYQLYIHPQTFTACQTAEAEHIPGRQLVKAVMMKAMGKDIMVVLPSTRTIDLLKISSALGSKDVRIEKEKEFEDLFPDCEAGAMPPLGNLYHIPCYADESIAAEEEIYFNAGNHTAVVKIAVQDFLRASKAIIGDFSVIGKKVAA